METSLRGSIASQGAPVAKFGEVFFFGRALRRASSALRRQATQGVGEVRRSLRDEPLSTSYVIRP
jgi:hypothetical protein